MDWQTNEEVELLGLVIDQKSSIQAGETGSIVVPHADGRNRSDPPIPPLSPQHPHIPCGIWKGGLEPMEIEDWEVSIINRGLREHLC